MKKSIVDFSGQTLILVLAAVVLVMLLVSYTLTNTLRSQRVAQLQQDKMDYDMLVLELRRIFEVRDLCTCNVRKLRTADLNSDGRPDDIIVNTSSPYIKKSFGYFALDTSTNPTSCMPDLSGPLKSEDIVVTVDPNLPAGKRGIRVEEVRIENFQIQGSTGPAGLYKAQLRVITGKNRIGGRVEGVMSKGGISNDIVFDVYLKTVPVSGGLEIDGCYQCDHGVLAIDSPGIHPIEVPEGCGGQVKVKIWGGGGGGGSGTRGGGGGYSTATIRNPNSKDYSVFIGGGGQGSSGISWEGAGGGGTTLFYRGQEVLVAGGGGGGGADGSGQGSGGAGGGLVGEDGDDGYPGPQTYFGHGGTQSSGGAPAPAYSSSPAKMGARNRGGDGEGNSGFSQGGVPDGGRGADINGYGGGGGGGGGYYGGGGGGSDDGAGGGGSGFISSLGLTEAETKKGARESPGNVDDPDRPNDAGRGGNSGLNGKSGALVFVW